MHDLGGRLRVLVVAGIPVGVVVAGIGSRLAMLLLRLTSPDSVRGVESDDGFTIGQVTLAGSYNLLLLGATIGIIGAAAYQWVRPWLLGPWWFRRLTTGASSAVVVGSMLLHADGIDFNVLQPTWLAIGLFIVLPGLFGVVIGSAVDRVGLPGSWSATGRRRLVVPIALIAMFPLVLVALSVAAPVFALWLAIRELGFVQRLRASTGYGYLVSAFWVLVVAAGLVALVNDITTIT